MVILLVLRGTACELSKASNITNAEYIALQTQVDKPTLVYFHQDGNPECVRIGKLIPNMSSFVEGKGMNLVVFHSAAGAPLATLFESFLPGIKGSFKYSQGPSFAKLISWIDFLLNPVKTITPKNINFTGSLSQNTLTIEGLDYPAVLFLSNMTEIWNSSKVREFALRYQGKITFAVASEDLELPGSKRIGVAILRDFGDGDILLPRLKSRSINRLLTLVKRECLYSIVRQGRSNEDAKWLFGKEGTKSLLLVAPSFRVDEYKPFSEAALLLQVQKPKLRIAHVSNLTALGKGVFEHLEIQSDAPPSIWILVKDEEGTTKFKLESQDKPITKKSILKFVQNFYKGKLEPFYKSQEPPTEDEDNGIVYLVGKTFKQKVFGSKESYLVFFFSPICPYCQALAPIFDALHQDVSALLNEQLKFAVIDGRLNEVPGLPVNGFPTIILFKEGEKDEPIDFTEERTRAGLLKFIEEQFPGLGVTKAAEIAQVARKIREQEAAEDDLIDELIETKAIKNPGQTLQEPVFEQDEDL